MCLTLNVETQSERLDRVARGKPNQLNFDSTSSTYIQFVLFIRMMKLSVTDGFFDLVMMQLAMRCNVTSS